MRGHLVAGLVLVAWLALANVHAQGTAPAAAASEHAAGRILVMPRPGLSDAALGRLLGDAGAGIARRVGASELRVVEAPLGQEAALVQRLRRHAHLKFAELDQRVQATAVANDPYFGSAWHLERISAPTAWDSTQGSGVTIAILDTGVDGSHPDLSSRMLPGWNFVDNNSNTSDVNGHGTGVAGTAAATTNNGAGVASVAGQSKILPVRIADANAYAYWSTIAQGVTWAADKGARVINISFDQLLPSSAVIGAAQYAKGKGALVVVAAGNRGQNENFTPSTAMIPVSALDRNSVITTWSSWGTYISMSAPGLDVWSTIRGGAYAQWYGTSVASPITAGVVALMMAANPGLSSTDVESLLFATADDLGAAGKDAYYGHGRVNASRAVLAAQGSSGFGAGDTQVPSLAILAPAMSSTVSGLTLVDVPASDNVGVARVELRVDGSLIATDTSSPFGFSWDTTGVAKGTATLVARACDAAGNCADSAPVAVNVANGPDLTPPTVSISNPGNGAKVNGNVSVSSSAIDNSGVSGLRLSLSINARVVASTTGSGTLKYSWNTRRLAPGTYTLRVDASDAAGNQSSTSVVVTH